MAERVGQVRWTATAGLLFAALAAGIGPVLWLGLREGLPRADAYLLRVLMFTLMQASLSTVFSIGLAIPVARALARQPFPGRPLMLWLFNLPQALPAIAAVVGIIAVFGAKGWLGGWFDIYGLQGILLAHVFFNFPLAARLFFGALQQVPAESWRLAEQLGFSRRDMWRLVEWPQIRASLPGAALLIFLLCAASFAVVLTLGGGPRATTLEVAIYQSLRADFDPARAALLALLQVALCGILVLAAQRLGGLPPVLPALRRGLIRRDGAATRWRDGAIIACGLLILLPPLAALVGDGAANLSLDADLGRAVVTSFLLGLASSVLALTLVWPFAASSSPMARLAVLSGWIIPPAVIATGWFIALSPVASLTGLAPLLVVAMNALMALPFAHNALAPAMAEARSRQDRLCASLGLSGWNRFRVIDLPTLRRPLALALTMAFVLSLGDLTAIALFGSQGLTTLPSLIYRQMGSYRFDDAAGTALLLMLWVLAMSAAAERWGAARD